MVILGAESKRSGEAIDLKTMERINEAGNDGVGGGGGGGNGNGNGIANAEALQRHRNNTNPNAEIIRGQAFEVGPRYTNLAYIGEGAYGMVV